GTAAARATRSCLHPRCSSCRLPTPLLWLPPSNAARVCASRQAGPTGSNAGKQRWAPSRLPERGWGSYGLPEAGCRDVRSSDLGQRGADPPRPGGRLRGYGPAPARHAPVPLRAPLLPEHLAAVGRRRRTYPGEQVAANVSEPVRTPLAPDAVDPV